MKIGDKVKYTKTGETVTIEASAHGENLRVTRASGEVDVLHPRDLVELETANVVTSVVPLVVGVDFAKPDSIATTYVEQVAAIGPLETEAGERLDDDGGQQNNTGEEE